MNVEMWHPEADPEYKHPILVRPGGVEAMKLKGWTDEKPEPEQTTETVKEGKENG